MCQGRAYGWHYIQEECWLHQKQSKRTILFKENNKTSTWEGDDRSGTSKDRSEFTGIETFTVTFYEEVTFSQADLQRVELSVARNAAFKYNSKCFLNCFIDSSQQFH